jgi:cytochrome c oxidase subunit 2
MSVERYEKIWMWAAAALLVLFLGAIGFTAARQAALPPGRLETVDPAALDSHPEFGNPTVVTRGDGSVVVPVVSQTFAFTPDVIEVPAGRPVTFRITSRDVMHGFQVVGTNANVMVLPGYVTEFTITFRQRGEHTIACNEYCGLAHQPMVGRLIVK